MERKAFLCEERKAAMPDFDRHSARDVCRQRREPAILGRAEADVDEGSQTEKAHLHIPDVERPGELRPGSLVRQRPGDGLERQRRRNH